MANRTANRIKAIAYVAGINPKPTTHDFEREFPRTLANLIKAELVEVVKDRVYATGAGIDMLHAGE